MYLRLPGLFIRWLTILYTTLATRLLTLPLVVKQHKGMARMSVSTGMPCMRCKVSQVEGLSSITCGGCQWGRLCRTTLSRVLPPGASRGRHEVRALQGAFQEWIMNCSVSGVF